jgi:hypothetical protein
MRFEMTMVLDDRKVDPVVPVLERQLQSQYAPPRIKRGAHPKMHGCVQAEFIVDAVVDQGFQHGVLKKPGNVYCAWVRFSNAFRIQHDLEAETRGIGIKLLHVTAERIDRLDDAEVDADGFVTQDFLCATHDAFFLPDNRDYAAFTEATVDPPKVVWFYFTRIRRLWRGAIALLRGASVLARSPLAIPYYSQTPYQLGSTKVKLQIKPVMTPELRRSLPSRFWFAIKVRAATTMLTLFEVQWVRPVAQFVGLPGTKEEIEDFCDRYLAPRDLLRRALMSHLANHDATFDVRVQPFVNERATPVHDATRRWRQRVSGFHHVATIRIPRQVFWPEPGMPADLANATKTMVDLGENMSFNPWHGLKAHEPLGAINGARGDVYREISKFRRHLNDVPPQDIVNKQACLYDELRKVVQGGRFDPCSDDRPDSSQ